MILAVHQPQYLPWLGYFNKIRKVDCFVFLGRVQYKPREYQNRNKIRTQHGWIWLTVPIISKGLGRQLICDARIDNSFDWQKDHWMSLKVCYSRAEFFSSYAPFFEEVYTKKRWDKLIDLNIYIIKYLVKEFGIETPLYLESDIKTIDTGTKRIIEICKKLKADVYLSGIGGREYLEAGRFAQEDIILKYQSFNHPVYKQCFIKHEKDFIPNMAAIDLLFNLGQKSKQILFRYEEDKNEHPGRRCASR